jgi:hypothetical protein
MFFIKTVFGDSVIKTVRELAKNAPEMGHRILKSSQSYLH